MRFGRVPVLAVPVLIVALWDHLPAAWYVMTHHLIGEWIAYEPAKYIMAPAVIAIAISAAWMLNGPRGLLGLALLLPTAIVIGTIVLAGLATSDHGLLLTLLALAITGRISPTFGQLYPQYYQLGASLVGTFRRYREQFRQNTAGQHEALNG